MANLGFATVSVIPVLKGGMSQLGDQIGAASKEGSEKSGTMLVGALGKAGKAGAVAAGAAIVAGLGKAMSSGWGRLVAIEEAEARMRGLGFEAETVASVMASANESVVGTTFSLAEAAGVAAMAVTAGIEPGQQLDGVLGTIANSAAAAGTDMAAMGALFNKVATVDMAQMDTLNQVSDRNIPILQALSDTLGVTTADVRKMASAGEIDFATFASAMQVATGTMADELGDTVPGAISLFTSALGRLGVALVSPVYDQLQGLLLDGRDGLDAMTAAVGPLAQAFSGWVSGGLAYVGAALAPLWQQIQGQLLPALQHLWQVVGPVLTPVLQFLGQMLMGVLKGAFDGIVMAVTGVIAVISGLASFIANVFTGNWSAAWEAVKQVFTGAIQAIAGAVLTWLNVTIIGAVRGGVVKLISAFTGGWNGIRNIFSSSLAFIRNLVSSVWQGIVGFFRGGMASASGIVTNGLNVLRSAFGGVFAAIRTVVSQAWSAIVGFVRTGMSNIVSVGRTGIQNFRSAITNGFNAVVTFVRSIPGRIRSALGNLGSMLQSSGRQLIAGFVAGIQQKFGDAVSAVKSGLQKVRNFFPFSPAKEGPFSGSGYTTHSGAAMMADYASSILAGGKQAARSARDAMAGVQREMSAHAGGANLAIAGGGGRVLSHQDSIRAAASTDLSNRLEAALLALAGQPIVVTVDGREIARASRAGGKALRL